MSEKDVLRAEIKARLGTLSLHDIAQKSSVVCRRVSELLATLPVTSLLSYETRLSPAEVDISELVNECQDKGIATQSVPLGKSALFPSAQFDVVVVPLLGFDDQCYRLGNGGGWYDRFLLTQPAAVTIGVGFEVAKLQQIPSEAHDVPLDYIITEDRLYSRPT